MSTNSIGETAKSHFESGYNCAESVLLALMETFGLKCNMAPRMSSGFGAGMGRCGHACGAFTGAVIGFGLMFGRDNPEDDREKIYPKIVELEGRFIREFGALDCRALIDFDLRTPDGREGAKAAGVHQSKCALFVSKTAEMAAEIAGS